MALRLGRRMFSVQIRVSRPLLNKMNNTKLNKELFPHTNKFMDWYKKEVDKGLVDIKFVTSVNDDTTLESFFSEVNEAIESPSVTDLNIF